MSYKGNNKTVNIRIRDCPESLRRRFKALCSREGKSYREMLVVLLDKYAPDIKMG